MKNEEKNSENYLKSKVKQPGFSLPKDYFDNFESTLDVKIIEESLPKNTGFKVPQNYFDNFENEILTKVNSSKKGKVVYLNSLKKVAAIAAIFVLGFVIYNQTNTKKSNYDEILSSFNTAEIETYLLENTHKYSSIDVVEVFDNQLNSIQNISESTIQTKAIENYIIENADESVYEIY